MSDSSNSSNKLTDPQITLKAATETPADLVTHFWQKSYKFYQHNGVQSLLLTLQDQYGYKVNRLLFCLWFSQLFQQLIDATKLSENIQSISAAEDAVASLRSHRRQFDNDFDKPTANHLGAAREQLLQAELSLEKEIQHRLVSLLCDGKYQPVTRISIETLDFLVNENINRLCSHRAAAEENLLQQVSMLWIQHQDCYN